MEKEKDFTNLNIRIDRSVKEGAEAVLNEIGLTVSGAINIYFRTIIRERKIPFELSLNTENTDNEVDADK